MTQAAARTICWRHLWNPQRPGVGLEHLLLGENTADSVLIALDEERGPFRLTYQLTWNEHWRLEEARLSARDAQGIHSLTLCTDGLGRWHDGNGQLRPDLDGCLDIDIWPTPFTNTFPLRREPMAIGERKEFRMAWVFAPDLTVKPQAQAYTRLAEDLYLFESLDDSGFAARLTVDAECLVVSYPDLFERITDP
jgi:hypothetical protein